MSGQVAGPLAGVRVLEFAGIGPGPYCAMLLSDMGADVVRIDRAGAKTGADPRTALTARGRRSIALDLKSDAGRATALALIEKAQVLIEGFRPGVMERLGLGPEHAFQRNAKLVYGRMTGWGQEGALSQRAGHDINYIAISGLLGAMGRPGAPPSPPLNVVGDFGAGSLFLAMGICAALYETQHSAKGQVIDCAISDGAASLGAMFYGMIAGGRWRNARGSNFLDGAAHFYDTYECADGKYLAIGSIEPEFYKIFLDSVGLGQDCDFTAQHNENDWPKLKQKLAQHLKQKTRDQWCALLEPVDACAAPVLDWREAPGYSHNVDRKTFVEIEGFVQPNVAPRFSRTPGKIQGPAPLPNEHRDAILRDWDVQV